MLDVTYYYVEEFVSNPEPHWMRVNPRGYEHHNYGLQDKAQAEEFVQKAKARWEEYLAKQEQTDHIQRLDRSFVHRHSGLRNRQSGQRQNFGNKTNEI